MAERLLKCYGYCDQKYLATEMIKVSNKNHCLPCAKRKEKEQKDRDLLYSTIKTVYKIPFPNGMMLKQIKEFKEERNYNYEGMTKTICYFIKIQRKEPMLRAGLAFVPYHYDNAIKYYEDLEEKRRQTENVDIGVKKVVIKPFKHTIPDFLKKRAFIDLGGLTGE